MKLWTSFLVIFRTNQFSMGLHLKFRQAKRLLLSEVRVLENQRLFGCFTVSMTQKAEAFLSTNKIQRTSPFEVFATQSRWFHKIPFFSTIQFFTICITVTRRLHPKRCTKLLEWRIYMMPYFECQMDTIQLSGNEVLNFLAEKSNVLPLQGQS